MTGMSRITVVDENRSTVVRMANARKDALACVTRMKDTRAKADGAANTAAPLLQAEVATTRAAAKKAGKVTAITPAIATAVMAPTGKTTTAEAPVATGGIGVVATGKGKAAATTDRVRVGTAREPATTDRVPATTDRAPEATARVTTGKALAASAVSVRVPATIRNVTTIRQTLRREGCTATRADAALTMIEVVMVVDKNAAMNMRATGLVPVENAAGGIGLLTP